MTNEIGSRMRVRRTGDVDPEVAESRDPGDGPAPGSTPRRWPCRRRPTRSSARRGRPSARGGPSSSRRRSDCQFVLVTKLTAVFNASLGSTFDSPLLSGSHGLGPLEQVESQDGDEAEGQQRDGVDVPALLPLRVDAEHAVDEPLDGEEDPVAGRLVLSEHLGHVPAQRARSHTSRATIRTPSEMNDGRRHQKRSGNTRTSTRSTPSATARASAT